jgi:hypothetical protein
MMQKHEWRDNPARCLKNKRIGRFNKLASKLMWKPYFDVRLTGTNQYGDPVVEFIRTRDRTFLGKIIHFIFRKRWKTITGITVSED